MGGNIMEKDKAKKEIKYLSKLINRCNDAYYNNKRDSLLSDSEFDQLFYRLIVLERSGLNKAYKPDSKGKSRPARNQK